MRDERARRRIRLRQGSENADRLFGDVRKLARARQRILAARDIFGAFGGGLLDIGLQRARRDLRDESAGLFARLHQRPRLLAQLCCENLEAAGAGGGVRHLVEIGFFQQHQLRVARDAAREFVGKADGLREGQHGNAIRAADGGREDGDGRAQHVHVRVAARHHAPRGFRVDQRGRRLQAAGFFHARPQTAQRANFCDAQKFVGVHREAERDRLGCGFERQSRAFQRAQIGQPG